MKVLEKRKEDTLKKQKSTRIWEFDFLRGIAFLLMVWDHVIYDLGAFFSVDTSRMGFFENGIGNISAFLFITLCGVSATLGKHNLKHSAQLLGLSLAITAATAVFDYFTNSGSLILFGILHFLCIGTFAAHFLKKLPIWALSILGIISYCLGKYFETIRVNCVFLFPLGLMSQDFYSADYFPVFPFLAYVILGVIIGKSVYKNKHSLFSFEPKRNSIGFLGRHTLFLYFAHQPLVLGILWVLFYILKH